MAVTRHSALKGQTMNSRGFQPTVGKDPTNELDPEGVHQREGRSSDKLRTLLFELVLKFDDWGLTSGTSWVVDAFRVVRDDLLSAPLHGFKPMATHSAPLRGEIYLVVRIDRRMSIAMSRCPANK